MVSNRCPQNHWQRVKVGQSHVTFSFMNDICTKKWPSQSILPLITTIDNSNTTITTQMSGEWLEQIINEASRLRRGFGIIFVHRSDSTLVPTLQSAITQAGFEDKLNGVVWLKQLRDGTQRALAIHVYDDSALIKPILFFVKHAIFVVGSSSASSVPTSVNRLVKSDTEQLSFSSLPDTSDIEMGCEYLCSVENRYWREFNMEQQKAIDLIASNIFTVRSWLFVTSQQHQHQLSMLFNAISERLFYLFDFNRVVMYRFKKQSPDNLPVLEPLAQLGFDPRLLLKVVGDDFICYYVLMQDFEFYVAKTNRRIFQTLSPWFLGYHQACWRFTFEMYNCPNNAHIKEQIGHLMALFAFRWYGGKPEWCDNDGVCKHMK